jgi:RNA polymerase sigma factor (sigma-70 family)
MKGHSMLAFGARFRPGGGPARESSPPRSDYADEFKKVILPHLDGAFNLACYLTRDPGLSEDIVQDSFVRAIRAFAQFRGGSPRAWLFAIVRNCCRTAQTGRTGVLGLVVHESSLSDEDTERLTENADPSPSPEEEVFRKVEVEHLRTAIEAMPEPFREAIVLRDLEDLSYAEIAEVTGAPIGTVMSRLSRGRQILANELLPPARNQEDTSRSAE